MEGGLANFLLRLQHEISEKENKLTETESSAQTSTNRASVPFCFHRSESQIVCSGISLMLLSHVHKATDTYKASLT